MQHRTYVPTHAPRRRPATTGARLFSPDMRMEKPAKLDGLAGFIHGLPAAFSTSYWMSPMCKKPARTDGLRAPISSSRLFERMEKNASGPDVAERMP